MRSFSAQCVLAILIANVILSFNSMADDWAQWRGHNRDGVSAEKGLAAKWPEDGPKLVWQVNDLGDGYSTPSVAGDRLFVMRNQGLDSEEVVCMSVTDGKKVWSQKVGKVGPNEGPQYLAARSTPTVSGNRVYALGSDGDIACLDITNGNTIWSKSFRIDFAGKPGQWAYAESPLVDGEAVICSPGGGQATVVALNKNNGNLIWKAALPEADNAGFSSPVVLHSGGVKQYVAFLAKGVVGLNADTGDVLWRYMKTADANANMATPVTQDGLVYTASSRAGGGLIQAAVTKGEPIEKYFSKATPSGMGGSVLIDGNLYGSQGNVFVCANYLTGDIKWQDRGIGAAASTCSADGKLFVHNENNDVFMVAASPTGFLLLGKFTPPNAPNRGKSKAWTYPIIANGKLYIRDVGTIWCYDVTG